MLKSPLRFNTDEDLRLKRTDLQEMVGLLMVHWFPSLLYRMGFHISDLLCSKCGEAEETAQYIIFDCSALIRKWLCPCAMRRGGQIGKEVNIIQSWSEKKRPVNECVQ